MIIVFLIFLFLCTACVSDTNLISDAFTSHGDIVFMKSDGSPDWENKDRLTLFYVRPGGILSSPIEYLPKDIRGNEAVFSCNEPRECGTYLALRIGHHIPLSVDGNSVSLSLADESGAMYSSEYGILPASYLMSSAGTIGDNSDAVMHLNDNSTVISIIVENISNPEEIKSLSITYPSKVFAYELAVSGECATIVGLSGNRISLNVKNEDCKVSGNNVVIKLPVTRDLSCKINPDDMMSVNIILKNGRKIERICSAMDIMPGERYDIVVNKRDDNTADTYPCPFSGALTMENWGVYGWGGSAGNVFYSGVKGTNTTVSWSDIEPEDGVYLFDEVIGTRLEEFYRKGMRTFLKIYIAPLTDDYYNSPRWLFESKNVPIVDVEPGKDPFGNPIYWRFPWYMDSTYIQYQARMINAFGDWIKQLPEHLRSVILFVQSAEGRTSDGSPYSGQPYESLYRISTQEWSRHRIRIWEMYKNALSDSHTNEMIVPLAVNYDSNDSNNYAWMKQNLGITMGLKNGMFSHGYDICDEIERKAEMDAFRDALRHEGKKLFIRGEQDKEWKNCGWSVRNPEQAYYWSAIYATYCGLDLWNFPSDACGNERFKSAIDFFNKYAGPHYPEESIKAFCALRKGLNVADTREFPESKYGIAQKDNIQRYLNIVNDYSIYGAIQGDPEAAIGTNMQNRQRSDYNDAGWNIFPGNYSKFITQLYPDETSVGLWHIDDSIYGCFARRFDNASGKNNMYFILDKGFGGNADYISCEISITYLDTGNGSWAFLYTGKAGQRKTAVETTNTGSGEWRRKVFVLNDLNIKKIGDMESDFILSYLSGDDTAFHLVEVKYLDSVPDFDVVEW